MSQEWLMLNIMLPQKPSSVRVSIWRKLKALGAANIGQSVWILPNSEENLNNYKEISIIADKNGGKAFIIKSDFLQMPENKPLEEYFKADRDLEYKELIEHCKFLLYEIKKETKKKNFTFAELEENEPTLERLIAWFKKIEARDFFGAPLKKEAESLLLKCKAETENFIEAIYRHNNDIGE